MDIRSYNRDAWNREVEGGKSRWTQPVTPEIIAKARQGEFSILLTENIPVPQRWFPPLKGADVLCLASGGGQQGPDGMTGYEGMDPSVMPPAMQGAQPRQSVDQDRLRIEQIEEDQRRGALPPPK